MAEHADSKDDDAEDAVTGLTGCRACDGALDEPLQGSAMEIISTSNADSGLQRSARSECVLSGCRSDECSIGERPKGVLLDDICINNSSAMSREAANEADFAELRAGESIPEVSFSEDQSESRDVCRNDDFLLKLLHPCDGPESPAAYSEQPEDLDGGSQLHSFRSMRIISNQDELHEAKVDGFPPSPLEQLRGEMKVLASSVITFGTELHALQEWKIEQASFTNKLFAGLQALHKLCGDMDTKSRPHMQTMLRLSLKMEAIEKQVANLLDEKAPSSRTTAPASSDPGDTRASACDDGSQNSSDLWNLRQPAENLDMFGKVFGKVSMIEERVDALEESIVERVSRELQNTRQSKGEHVTQGEGVCRGPQVPSTLAAPRQVTPTAPLTRVSSLGTKFSDVAAERGMQMQRQPSLNEASGSASTQSVETAQFANNGLSSRLSTKMSPTATTRQISPNGVTSSSMDSGALPLPAISATTLMSRQNRLSFLNPSRVSIVSKGTTPATRVSLSPSASPTRSTGSSDLSPNKYTKAPMSPSPSAAFRSTNPISGGIQRPCGVPQLSGGASQSAPGAPNLPVEQLKAASGSAETS